jgi:hypothetical protein
MMLSIYYIIGILITMLLVSLLFIQNKVLNIIEWFEKFEKVTGKKPEFKDFRNNNDYNLLVRSNIILILEYIWLIFGLLTNFWIISLSILVLKFIRLFIKRKWSIVNRIISYNFLIVKIIIYSALILNHFKIVELAL